MRKKVFVNRTLNLKKIKYIGFDMDHTLVRYNCRNFEESVYNFVVDYLIKQKHYPQIIKDFKFNFNNAIRGLVVDSANGNILKLSRYGTIRQSYHGVSPISFTDQKQIYKSTYVDLNDSNYIAIDTYFSIAFCVLYGQLVNLKDMHPTLLPSYEILAFDILYSVDKIHANGDLKNHICANIANYVTLDEELVRGLQTYKRFGKKLFVLTNSDFAYSKVMLDYVINRYLPKNESWQNLFDYTITLSNKPRFFYDNLQFLRINPANGNMTNLHKEVTPGIYQGGNAKQFTKDLSIAGDEILYIGDHIYGDILRLKKECNWRTALVVEELGTEIAMQSKILPIEQKIKAHMQQKQKLEDKYVHLQTIFIDKNNATLQPELTKLQNELTRLDNVISDLVYEESKYYSSTWGRVFRAGAEESYFAHQVERYACIYMDKLSDLLKMSPLTYFRSDKRKLAHDID